MKRAILSYFRKENLIEILVGFFALVTSAWMTWYVYRLGLTLALTDQNAHLNFARLTFDSFTPGLSQIGFWPPLLHLLMIPVVAVEDDSRRALWHWREIARSSQLVARRKDVHRKGKDSS
jgi:hypothetical protein